MNGYEEDKIKIKEFLVKAIFWFIVTVIVGLVALALIIDLMMPLVVSTIRSLR